jgi:hypothetical protein
MERQYLTTYQRFDDRAETGYMSLQGRADQMLAAGVEANKKALMQRNSKLTVLEAHRLAITAALKDNPGLLILYRSYGKEQR